MNIRTRGKQRQALCPKKPPERPTHLENGCFAIKGSLSLLCDLLVKFIAVFRVKNLSDCACWYAIVEWKFTMICRFAILHRSKSTSSGGGAGFLDPCFSFPGFGALLPLVLLAGACPLAGSANAIAMTTMAVIARKKRVRVIVGPGKGESGIVILRTTRVLASQAIDGNSNSRARSNLHATASP